MADNSYFSNDLHELLLEKDMVEFWKSWNSKVTKAKPSIVIDNETDGRIIAEKFATHFQQSCTLHDTAESQSISTADDMTFVIISLVLVLTTFPY